MVETVSLLKEKGIGLNELLRAVIFRGHTSKEDIWLLRGWLLLFHSRGIHICILISPKFIASVPELLLEFLRKENTVLMMWLNVGRF